VVSEPGDHAAKITLNYCPNSQCQRRDPTEVRFSPINEITETTGNKAEVGGIYASDHFTLLSKKGANDLENTFQ
jgi:hypothetical protein